MVARSPSGVAPCLPVVSSSKPPTLFFCFFLFFFSTSSSGHTVRMWPAALAMANTLLLLHVSYASPKPGPPTYQKRGPSLVRRTTIISRFTPLCSSGTSASSVVLTTTLCSGWSGLNHGGTAAASNATGHVHSRSVSAGKRFLQYLSSRYCRPEPHQLEVV